MILLLTISICHGVHGNCFQDVAQRVESGSIEGFSMTGSPEENIPIIIDELETCLQVSGSALYAKLVENYVRLKTENEGTESEFHMTWTSAGFLREEGISEREAVKILAPIWYNSNAKAKEIYFSVLSDFAGRDVLDQNRDILWGYNFSLEKGLLDTEQNKTSELSLALLDFIFALAPGPALLTLNDTMTSEEKETLKQSISLPVQLHWKKSPRSWKKENLQPAKETLKNLTLTNYGYVDLFIAEIVNVVHDLRTPEVDAFLAQSTHPLVQRRLREPFVYVPLVIPE